jgi:hypothetical protein
MLPDKLPAASYLDKITSQAGVLYGLLWLPLLIPLTAFALHILSRDSFMPSLIGMAAYGLFSIWFVKGISGGAGEDVPEGEAEFGISFILLGLVSFGITFSLALGIAGIASDSLAIGMIVLLGGLIALGVAPGIEPNGEWQVAGLVLLGGGGSLGMAYLLGGHADMLLMLILVFAHSLAVASVAHLSILNSYGSSSPSRPLFIAWLLAHGALIGWCLGKL